MKKIETVTVVGAGIMGRGIAQVCARHGLKVNLHDVSEEVLLKSQKSIRSGLARLASKGEMSEDQLEEAVKRIRAVTDLEAAVGGVDLIIEAVPENPDLKRKVLAEIDEAAGADAIIASNTSSISITELASATGRPDRFIGTHFFNPVPIMKGVEVIKGADTSDASLESVLALHSCGGSEKSPSW